METSVLPIFFFFFLVVLQTGGLQVMYKDFAVLRKAKASLKNNLKGLTFTTSDPQVCNL